MKIHLTKGLFGLHIKQIGSETDYVNAVFEHVFAWKHDLENRCNYKVESYDRLIFREDAVAIDFGDHSHFLLVSEVSSDQMKAFKEI